MHTPSGLRRAHLSICPPDLFSKDRDRLVSGARNVTGNRYTCPAEALEDVLSLLGYQLRQIVLPEKIWGEVLPGQKVVHECANMETKLRHPASAPLVRTFTLAHELAHIRLHVRLILAGQMKPCHEEEANRYAEVFLMPVSILERQPEWAEVVRPRNKSSDFLWELTRGLASCCRVSGSAMAVRLTHLGILHHDKTTRELRAA